MIGIAIDSPGDFVTARRNPVPGLTFSVRTADVSVPTDPSSNVAAYVASLMLAELRPPFGVTLELAKKMPVGSGLGSSAASSVASVVSVNALLLKPLRRYDLLRFALEGERMASGAPHADNIAPSLLGGACLIRSYDPLDVISLPLKNTVVWVVVHPHIVVRTAEARAILPKEVPLTSAIRQWGNVGGLTAGLALGDAGLIGRCVHDVIVEPLRAPMIPCFHEIKEAALTAGATGCSISGSGPSVFAVATSASSARKIGASMKRVWKESGGLKADVYISRVNMRGAVVIKRGTR